jgi:putative membrane protein
MENNTARINKDLILREKLAIERTAMAIDTTLLSFIRTSLYFAIAGLSVRSLLKVDQALWIEIVFWALSLLILVAGLITFFRQKKKLQESKRHIGNYMLEWEDDID